MAAVLSRSRGINITSGLVTHYRWIQDSMLTEDYANGECSSSPLLYVIKISREYVRKDSIDNNLALC